MNRLEIQKQYVTGVVVTEYTPNAIGGFKPWGTVRILLRGNPDNPSDKLEIDLFVDGNAASAARELARQLNEAATIAESMTRAGICDVQGSSPYTYTPIRKTQGLVAADAAE